MKKLPGAKPSPHASRDKPLPADVKALQTELRKGAAGGHQSCRGGAGNPYPKKAWCQAILRIEQRVPSRAGEMLCCFFGHIKHLLQGRQAVYGYVQEHHDQFSAREDVKTAIGESHRQVASNLGKAGCNNLPPEECQTGGITGSV